MSSIQKVRYTHDAIIDVIIAFPAISQGDLAREFGFTQTWMSIIINSPEFKLRLAERKGELVDPKIRASIEERLEGLAKRALDKLLDRLDNTAHQMKDADLIAVAKLGVGNKNAPPIAPQVSQNLYVVQLPSPASSAKEWMSTLSKVGGSPEMTQNPEGVYSVGGT